MNPGGNHFVPVRTRRRVLLLGVMVALMFCAACGKKGPLYLPDEATAPAKTGAEPVSPTATPAGKK